ncbi:MAG: class I SAM-dependent methyltransferase [Bdellovibrionota bacterium]
MTGKNTNSYKIEQMRQFYEMFPYPNRFIFLTPYIASQLTTHGAFSKLVGEGQTTAAESILTKTLRVKQRKNFQTKSVLKNLTTIFPSSKKILLIGCGTDEPLLFRMLHQYNDLVCVELSKKNIKIARKKLFFHCLLSYFKLNFSTQGKTEFIVGDAGVILKQKYIGQFDYIQCFGVLHHQPNPEDLLSGISDRLVGGGYVRIMVYSYHGRRLERKIQKKYHLFWENISKTKQFKVFIFYKLFLLRIWQLLNFFGLKKTTSLRFKYLGLNSKKVADALMHPSDPGLSLESILPMAEKYKLKLVYCQAKLEKQGLVYGFQEPLKTWASIVSADKKQTLLNNPILIFSKVPE